MPKSPPVIVWFRRDLRLSEHPALMAACRTDQPVIPVFILDEDSAGQRRLGGAAYWWLGRSLAALATDLQKKGSALVLRRGRSLDILRQLVAETGATSVQFNRRYDPPGLALDQQVSAALRADGVDVVDHDGNYLHEPWQVQTGQGAPFKVFTPFWRRLAEQYSPPPAAAASRRWTSPTVLPAGEPVTQFRHERPWSAGFGDVWQPGEAGAQRRLQRFLDAGADGYATLRDRPDHIGTSRLSPHLAWGEISIHEAWRRADPARWSGAGAFRRELAWRDFNMHLYYHYPDLPTECWQKPFQDFPFKADTAGLQAWQQGRTGYPLVDAGLRELWHTGWMHNRVRMVVASFLIKHQLIDWRRGEAWFWDTLVDADPAQNAGNWQWVAGCGFDAAPFFRIFNPILQGAKFDPQGLYTRNWVPELAGLTNKELNEPWKASSDRLRAAGITLGDTYPRPVVQHEMARQRALAAYRQISGKTAGDHQRDLFTDETIDGD
jgi:deoxyribodipyrimidine photo-lyase